jgi:hypothetical protein
MFRHLVNTNVYWRGTWFDLWSIPHVFFGFIIALGASLIGFDEVAAYSITASLALVWEIFERLTDISKTETPVNSLTDILFALVGFGVGILFLELVKNTNVRFSFFVFSIIIWALINLLGWFAHRYYANTPA